MSRVATHRGLHSGTHASRHTRSSHRFRELVAAIRRGAVGRLGASDSGERAGRTISERRSRLTPGPRASKEA